MKSFKFLCPQTGHVVHTGMDLDAPTFAHLPRETLLSCPHCDEPHPLAHVSAWLGDLQTE
jgi:hypothetical protein